MQNSLIILKSTLSRLPSYYCLIEEYHAEGEEYVSATTIAESLSINPVQVRKDLASICSDQSWRVSTVMDILSRVF